MSKEDDWIETVVDAARKTHDSDTEAVVSCTKEVLKKQLTQRQLSTAELKSLATTLISEMVHQPSNIGNKNED